MEWKKLFNKISFEEVSMLVTMIEIIIRSLIQVGTLLIGMYYLFNGDKRWRWFNASLVVLTIVVMLKQ
ncbi:hypothetical protein PBV87_12805 [Niameybacter massiliensis]|uniref:Uncharacterized protein n=1 Tax=Holtiella tumoricola TaxID=3018743 RepID=A0AA42DNP9_9FIRM|nr:hypothetical protein [Holtiella tumoricola]MDA3732368.1 hypothetical protein [Holtiella tumoricola]